jgi:O-methyltransferase involved in polyketide biosynthesis
MPPPKNSSGPRPRGPDLVFRHPSAPKAGNMESKISLDLRGVRRTLLIPLWGRSVYGSLYPEILRDQEAVNVMRTLNHDFGPIEKAFGEYGGLLYVIRARQVDDAVRHFVAARPGATVVNLGAGLDTGFSRVDNGSIHWHDLDLEDVIALRKRLIPEGPRNKCLAKSVLDHSWFNDIRFNEKDGIFFIGSGIFFYFQEAVVRDLFLAMAKRFPGGEIFFDCQTRLATRISNRMVGKTGNSDALMSFYINSPKLFASWSPSLILKDTVPFGKGIKKDKRWKLSSRLSLFFLDLLKMASFYHLAFPGTFPA